MKKDWTYKKLGEVAEIVGGSTPKTSEPANWEGSNMWVTPAELDGSKYFGKTQRTISDKAASKLQLLPIGTVLFSSRAPIGKVAITTAPMYCNQGFKNVICGDNLYNEYVYWCLTYNIPLLQSLGVGATFKELSKSAMSDFSIPIPPLSIQRSIVAELDLLHSVISKKKEQLRELDNLAQSLFYQMFGDPITNPKQWEVKKLIEIVHKDCPVSYGIVQPGDGEIDGVPVVRPIDLKDSEYITKEELKLTTKEISDSYSRTILRGIEILICVRGTTGLLGLVSHELKGCNVTRGIVPLFFAEDVANKQFMYAALKTDAIQGVIADKTYGATLKQINIKDLRDIEFPLPPLSLQQFFAAKVSAIEAQKQAITQSIHHTEALLAQRMDQYFA